MSIYESHRRKIIGILIILFFGIVIFGRELKLTDYKKVPENKSIAHLPYKTLYKTIPDSKNAIGLIGYELHEDGDISDGEETYPTYSVVVKNIDSQTDNYKSLCRDIISDVIQTCGDKRVIVNIYDSFEAYSLAASYEQQSRFLTKEEEEAVNNHRVATYAYDADYSGSEAYYLTYYPDAHNGLLEKEVYSTL